MKNLIVMTFAACALAACAAEKPHDNPPEGFKLSDWQKRYMPEPLEKRIARIQPVKEGELRLVPTFVNCSVVWGAAKPVEGLAVECRPCGGTWTAAEKPIHFADVGNYRSSVLGLKEDTEYEVRVKVKGEEGKVFAKGSFRTWKSEVPVAKTIVVDPATATYPIKVSDEGTPDGWIRYTVKPGAVLGGKDCRTSVFDVKNAKYVLIENLTIQGGGGAWKEYPIFIADSHAVRVRNCEIYGWGREGETVYTAKGKGVLCVGGDERKTINCDAAIMIDRGTTEIVVERCYIHDARNRSNSWYYSHPAGNEGIYLNYCGHGVVLRWNDIIGSDFHRFNDCIEGGGNFFADGGFNRDADIYGNFCIFANDDNIELDGGMQNVRCFQNRFESAVSSVSIQGCCTSPVYVYDNLFAPGCDEFGAAFECVKTSTFDPYWYAPYAMLQGNWFAERAFRPSLGQTSRWDCRDDNTVTTNEIPRAWATNYPVRDLPFVLDCGFIRGVETRGSAPVVRTFKAIAKLPQAYRVRKPFDADWFDVTPAEGTLQPGETTFTVTIRPEKMRSRRHWRAAFLLQTPEGLSRGVSVYADNADFRTSDQPVPPSAKTIYAKDVKPEGGEFAFDVTEEGDYHFFVKAIPTSDSRFPRLLASVDGSEPKQSILWLEKTHEVWTLVRPGNTGTCGNPGTLQPFHLTPGRHVLTVSPVRGRGAFRLTGVALSDHTYEFEAH